MLTGRYAERGARPVELLSERWWIVRAVLSLLVVAAVVQGQEANEAEKLFRAMEKTLTDAKTLQVALEAKVVTPKGDMTLKAKLIAAGNKWLLKGETSIGGMFHDLDVVYDGKQVKGQVFGKKFSAKDSLNDPNQNLLVGAVRRIGILPALFFGVEKNEKKEASVEDIYKVSDFKLGDKMKINGRAAQGFQYQLKVPALSAFKAEVVVDTETKVPLRRTLSTEKDGQKISVVETYSVQLNAKIDDKDFELK
jgi:outer membrane lipoprotein-sorting protein